MLKTLQGWSVLILVTAVTGLTGCNSKPVRSKPANAVSVMSYNVENLFDTQHDEGKNDYTFLPAKLKKTNLAMQAGCDDQKPEFRKEECINTDWNDEVLALKMKRLADTILSVNGVGPDVLILEEVENFRVLHQLNEKYLAKAQYQTEVLIEGEDERGIDVALLSRLPVAGPSKLHQIEFKKNPDDPKWKKPRTRGILEVPLKLPNGETLTVLGFHMPSQGAPTESRRDAINSLNQILETKNPKSLVVAGGDCNVSAKEEAVNGLQSKLMASHWTVSHLVGCKDCPGSETYHDQWNWFDVLLFSPQLTNGQGSYQLKPETIETPKSGHYQLNIDGTPARFDRKGSVGISDHLPIYGEIVPKD